MSFKGNREADLARSFSLEESAESVVYSAVDGASISTAAIIDIGDELMQGAVGSSAASIATIRVMKSVIAEPKVDDFVIVGGLEWRIIHILRDDAGVWVLSAVRDERMSAR